MVLSVPPYLASLTQFPLPEPLVMMASAMDFGVSVLIATEEFRGQKQLSGSSAVMVCEHQQL